MKKIFSLIIIVLFLTSCKTHEDALKINSFTEKYLKLDTIKNSVTISKNYKIMLKHDFSKKYKIYYECFQKKQENYRNNFNTSVTSSTSFSTLTLIFNSKGNKIADLIYKDKRTISKIKLDITKDEVKEMSEGPKTIFHQNYNEDGSLPNNKLIEFATLLLFPISKKKLSKNKSIEVDIRLPMDFHGSTLVLQGLMKITCIEFVKVNDDVCAKIITNFNIIVKKFNSNITQLDFKLIGYGLFYYNIENFNYIFGKLVTNIEIKSEIIVHEIKEEIKAFEIISYQLKKVIFEQSPKTPPNGP